MGGLSGAEVIHHGIPDDSRGFVVADEVRVDVQVVKERVIRGFADCRLRMRADPDSTSFRPGNHALQG
jgi:hypothetical protein